MSKINKYKSIDLFAGIGGIRLGFEKAFKDRIETVFVSEWDEKAQETYRANFNDIFDIAGDITEISESDIPNFDICLAGFPCQAFSIAGKHNGFEEVSQNGSHVKMKNFQTGKQTIIPYHNKALKKGLEQAILKQAGLK